MPSTSSTPGVLPGRLMRNLEQRDPGLAWEAFLFLGAAHCVPSAHLCFHALETA
jgi:hypothetical protein